MTQANQYTEAAVQRLLTENGDVTDQAIEAVLREGGVLILRGEVESPNRRAVILRLIGEHFPDLQVHADIGLTRANPPAEPEELA